MCFGEVSIFIRKKRVVFVVSRHSICKTSLPSAGWNFRERVYKQFSISDVIKLMTRQKKKRHKVMKLKVDMRPYYISHPHRHI